MTTTDNPLSYDPTYEDTDQRLGGNDEPVLLEKLHEQATQVAAVRGTTYEVQLRVTLEDDTAAWLPLGVTPAGNARDAMRAHSGSSLISPGDVLRATPVRNITELTLDIETTTRLRLS